MDKNNELASGESASNSATRPVVSFSGSGGLRVAVWKNKSESGNDYYSVKVERSYKDDAGEFHSTAYLGESDLLRAQKLLGDADSWIEQDRQKQRVATVRDR